MLALVVGAAGCMKEAGSAVSEPASQAESRVFRGAWFEVVYPADFTVRPSLASTTAEGYDSAEFVSPDGAVSFYVFAPQWGGEPTDIALDPKRERLVAEQTRQAKEGARRWFTIAAKDGSYQRSYQEMLSEHGSVKTVVGIKYRDEEARQKHLAAYQRFKDSLQLYAD